ncbi:hypothetical protein [Nitrospira sp. Nam74]
MGWRDITAQRRASGGMALLGLLVAYIALGGCARLPYTTKVLHQDRRVVINAQEELDRPGYTHPMQLSAAEVASILRGLSVREQQRLPLRWFAEEVPPKAVFRADEIEALAPYLADALTKVGPNERVHFDLIGPGFNPSMEKDAVSGWVAVRDPYLYFTLEYFHIQVPTRSSDPYDYNYPTPAPLPKNYLLYFEPGRFWVTDQNGRRAVEYRSFLKSAPSHSGAGTAAPSAPAGAP